MPSVTDLLFQNDHWVLESLDTGNKIEGQFNPTDLTENISAEYAEVATLGRAQPILQFQSSGARTFSFTAKSWAHHQGIGLFGYGTGLLKDTIEDFVEKLKAACQISPDFGRPEIFSFQVGESVSMDQCVVKSLGGIRYDRLRATDGTLRGVTFSITLQEFVSYDTSLTGGGSESLVLALRENEGFEGIARRVYGDPIPGEALRRRSPAKVIPEVGELVHLPPKARLMAGFLLQPQSWLMKRTATNTLSRLAYFKERDRRYTLFSVDWGA